MLQKLTQQQKNRLIESFNYSSAYDEARDLFSLCYQLDELSKELFFIKVSEIAHLTKIQLDALYRVSKLNSNSNKIQSWAVTYFEDTGGFI